MCCPERSVLNSKERRSRGTELQGGEDTGSGSCGLVGRTSLDGILLPARWLTRHHTESVHNFGLQSLNGLSLRHRGLSEERPCTIHLALRKTRTHSTDGSLLSPSSGNTQYMATTQKTNNLKMEFHFLLFCLHASKGTVVFTTFLWAR